MLRGSCPWLSFSDPAVLAVNDKFALFLLSELASLADRVVLAVVVERMSPRASSAHSSPCGTTSLLASEPPPGWVERPYKEKRLRHRSGRGAGRACRPELHVSR